MRELTPSWPEPARIAKQVPRNSFTQLNCKVMCQSSWYRWEELLLRQACAASLHPNEQPVSLQFSCRLQPFLKGLPLCTDYVYLKKMAGSRVARLVGSRVQADHACNWIFP